MREIRTVVLQREFKLIAQLVARPILGRIDLLDHPPHRVDPVDSTGRDKGFVPVGDDLKPVPLDERGVSCRSLCRLLLELFRPWSTQEKRSHNENFSHLSAIGKKNDPDKEHSGKKNAHAARKTMTKPWATCN